MAPARVVVAGDALLLVRRDDPVLGERWDLPRGESLPLSIHRAEDRGAIAVEHADREAVEAPLAWHPIASLERSWVRGGITITADVASVIRTIGARSVTLAAAEGSSSLLLAPGIRMLPVRTPTLPPATHTNLFVIGARDAVLIEPATPYADELDRVAEWVGSLEGSEGIAVRAILLTHHHVDHVGGARALREALGAPLVAHAETGTRLDRGVSIERALIDGERIDLGTMDLRAVHTPGHAAGHLCFVEERSGVMVAGDMVAGTGTILVEPGDGDMTLYLESLRRMAAAAPTLLAPAHGGALRPPVAVLERYVEHRLARERKVLDALSRFARPVSAGELLPDAYGDAPRAVWPLAVLSTEAHLLKLERDGRARRDAAGWVATPLG